MKKPRVNYQARIPGYVLALRDVAERAGLLVSFAHDTETDHVVMTWTGGERQFRDTGIFPPCMIFPRNQGIVISPWYFRGCGIETTSDAYRIASAWELPAKISRNAGVVSYTFADECVMLWGTADALQTAGVQRRLDLGRTKITRLYRDRPKERVSRWPNGLYTYWTQSEKTAKAEEEMHAAELEAARRDYAARPIAEPEGPRLQNFDSPEDFRQCLASAARMSALSMIEAFSEARTRRGFHYRLTPDALERAEAIIASLYEDLCALDVSVSRIDARPDSERQEAARRVAQAEADPSFRAFMRDVLPRGAA